MVLFWLTAREGRVSANQFGCPSSRNSQTRPTFVHVPRRRTRVPRSPRPAAIPSTKPAIPRVFYVGTNSPGQPRSRLGQGGHGSHPAPVPDLRARIPSSVTVAGAFGPRRSLLAAHILQVRALSEPGIACKRKACNPGGAKPRVVFPENRSHRRSSRYVECFQECAQIQHPNLCRIRRMDNRLPPGPVSLRARPLDAKYAVLFTIAGLSLRLSTAQTEKAASRSEFENLVERFYVAARDGQLKNLTGFGSRGGGRKAVNQRRPFESCSRKVRCQFTPGSARPHHPRAHSAASRTRRRKHLVIGSGNLPLVISGAPEWVAFSGIGDEPMGGPTLPPQQHRRPPITVPHPAASQFPQPHPQFGLRIAPTLIPIGPPGDFDQPAGTFLVAGCGSGSGAVPLASELF